MATTGSATGKAGEELVITRVIDAPRSKVFKAWTDEKQVAEWWGPEGFTNPVCNVDARPGGKVRVDMRGPDGTVYPTTGVFDEVVEPERLVITSSALDEQGNSLLEDVTTVTFTEENGKTTQRLQARVTKAVGKGLEYAKGMKQGWESSLDRLEKLLARG